MIVGLINPLRRPSNPSADYWGKLDLIPEYERRYHWITCEPVLYGLQIVNSLPQIFLAGLVLQFVSFLVFFSIFLRFLYKIRKLRPDIWTRDQARHWFWDWRTLAGALTVSSIGILVFILLHCAFCGMFISCTRFGRDTVSRRFPITEASLLRQRHISIFWIHFPLSLRTWPISHVGQEGSFMTSQYKRPSN